MRMSLRIYSTIVVSCCLAFVVACSAKKPSAGAELRQSQWETAELRSRYGEVSHPAAAAYLDYLARRLTAARHVPNGQSTTENVVLLATTRPLALSSGPDTVLISRGLILCQASEDELAFVIAHELAHQALHHTHIEPRGDRQLALEQETAADIFALDLLAAAGYAPQAAIDSILHTYQYCGQHIAAAGTHPDPQSRILALRARAQVSGLAPRTPIRRRDFVSFRKILTGQ
jgi:predicted Zn-dependent protease